MEVHYDVAINDYVLQDRQYVAKMRRDLKNKKKRKVASNGIQHIA